MGGVFFAPKATVTYAGNGFQQQAAAQFISDKLAVSGSGLLVIKPDTSRAVLFPAPNASTLIR